MTDQERETYRLLSEAADYQCTCDHAEGRAACARHTGKRCDHGRNVLVTEPSGEQAVICWDCKEARERAARKAEQAAKDERAQVFAEAQLSLFDL